MTFLKFPHSSQHTAQNIAELQNVWDEKNIVSGIGFEAIQFGVGDENGIKMKQNQPHVNHCWSWLMGTWSSLYYYFYFFVYLKIPIIKKIFF